MSETPRTMSQHEGRGMSFMLGALQVINVLHGNAPTTMHILDEQFAITCKEGWVDPAVLFHSNKCHLNLFLFHFFEVLSLKANYEVFLKASLEFKI